MKTITKLAIKTAAKFLKRNDSKRLNQLKADETLKVIKDISYINDGKKEHYFDLHYPNTDNGWTIIQIHGGGYIYSYKENNFYYSEEFARRGFKVVNANYTLCDGNTSVVTVLRELGALINFVIENYESLDIDLSKLVIMGDSAGGHLALLLSLAVNHDDVASDLGISFIKKIHVDKVVLASPIYDYKFVCEKFKKCSTKGALKFLTGEDFKDERYPLITCPRYILNKNIDHYYDFELFVSSCKSDFIKQQSLYIQDDLKDKFTFFFVDDEIEKLDHIFPIICPNTNAAKKCNDMICEFIKKPSL